jgi:hypothetical protein
MSPVPVTNRDGVPEDDPFANAILTTFHEIVN